MERGLPRHYARINLLCFFVLIFGAAFDAGEFHVTEPLFGWSFLRGKFYIGFSFLMDLFGLFVFIGVLMAVLRRYIIDRIV